MIIYIPCLLDDYIITAFKGLTKKGGLTKDFVAQETSMYAAHLTAVEDRTAAAVKDATDQDYDDEDTDVNASQSGHPAVALRGDDVPLKKKKLKSGGSNSSKTVVTKPSDDDLPKFNIEHFTPGYTPKRVSKGENEYNIVVTGIRDTGLCGTYWSLEGGERGRGRRRSSLTAAVSNAPNSEKNPKTVSVVKAEIGKGPAPESKDTPICRSVQNLKRKLLIETAEDENDAGKKEAPQVDHNKNSMKDFGMGEFAPYTDLHWESLVRRPNHGIPPDAVQHAVVLRPPYHIVSRLRIKGFHKKGLSHTTNNTMVFTMMEGEVTVLLPTKDLKVVKGDSFLIPPRTKYDIHNEADRDAEISLIQYRYRSEV